MTRRSIKAALVLTCVCIHAAAAQEGHPLTGTWSGDWGVTAAERTHVTLVMNWDGKTISGMINPGPDAIAIDRATLDVTSWSLRIEAQAKDESGTLVPLVAEGQLADLGSYHRTLSGTWMQGKTKGTFRVTRN
jgi:hypothetical protein